MKSRFQHTKSMALFILKKEGLRLPLFVVGVALFMIFLVPVFDDILATSYNHQALISTMKNPAMIAMVGPVYVENAYTVGSIYANYMTVFMGLIFAAWNILFVTRHTRREEEQGTMELVQSLGLGRVANLTATLLVAFFANLVLCMAIALGLFLISSGYMPFSSSLNFALATTAFGFLFALIGGLFAQLATTSRMANSLSLILLMVTYLVRAVGDLANPSLSLLSPLGLISRTKSFVTDDWWPILILLGIGIVILLLTYLQALNRDLQGGILREGKGRTSLSPLVRGTTSFTFYLQRYQFLLWALVIFSFSAMYGSIFGDLESFIESSDLIKQMLATGGSSTNLTDQFIAMLMVIMAMITTIPVLYFANRILSEEKKSHSENILTKPVSRPAYFLSFILLAVLATILYQVLVALGFWAIGRLTLPTIAPLSTFLAASLNYIPAILFTLATAAFLIGYLPRLSWLSYLYLGYSVSTIYLGRLLNFPDFLEKLTPFGYISNYPLQPISTTALLTLTATSLLLIFLGLMGYQRRDLA